MSKSARLGLVAAVCAGIALAGCGSEHVGTSSGDSTAAAARTVAPAPTPAQRAATDAAGLLAAFPVPPGATRTAALPVSSLSHSPETYGSPDLVTRTGWWRVAGQPVTVLTWIRAHMPSGFTLAASGSGGHGKQIVLQPIHGGPNQPAATLWFDEFTKPAVAGVLPARWLVVAVAGDGTGQTAVRVDSEVAWQPAKPATERIPATAKVVTIVPSNGPGPVSAYTQPVTITDPVKVAKIAAAVDGLALFPVGRMCPMDRGMGMRLEFRATPTGPEIAEVTADSTGCQTVTVMVNGQRQPTLGGADTLERQVTTIAGVHWPGFPGA